MTEGQNYLELDHPLGKMLKLDKHEDELYNNHHFKLFEALHRSVLAAQIYPEDGDVVGNVRSRAYYVSRRQQYLRSYRFSRKHTIHDFMNCSLAKFKAMIWTILICDCSVTRRKLP
ncbi:hypothetical protein O6H91_05G092200 [Diphasiastrum complanatum]|uniref:Uncharacterized protein n=1 Tax=Diphasiastrum complanatum TaxID=34168 RepID=A0ACC2DR46_DIPCM|nr:hypothetical protein O6H91_05G092200 [Diphasiastrum complanatum]